MRWSKLQSHLIPRSARRRQFTSATTAVPVLRQPQSVSGRLAGQRRFLLSTAATTSGYSPRTPAMDNARTIHLGQGNGDYLFESCDQRYQAAVSQLNQLQSNAVTLATRQGKERQRFLDTWKYLRRSGMTLEQLDQLPVIHVAGTKGKGSVCSFVESILRQHGLRTGFFSSPHLVSVTERIRVNGTPITSEHFSQHFWRLFHVLDAAKEAPDDIPPYFKFLTIMAFHVFIAERVDVAIIEVGIGGLHDCTNIVRDTRTVGITSLGLDHVSVLGNTIEMIARQKAGIIKRRSHVYTVRQPGRANEVISEVAEEKEAPLSIVPDFDEYSWSRELKLNLSSQSVHKLNISLAIQLSIDWLVQQGRLESSTSRLHCTEAITAGVEQFHWPGRYQVIHQSGSAMSFYLDGAHTLESVVACLAWFQETSRRTAVKCLMFFVTGTRDVESLARPFVEEGGFDLIVICPNVVDSRAAIMDNVTVNVDEKDLEVKCDEIRGTFRRMAGQGTRVEASGSVSDALRLIEGVSGGEETDVLITGSLYLVGTALIALNQCRSTRESA